MKKILLILTIIPYFIFSQDVTETTILHNGLDRSYILYIPTSYSENEPAPLVLNLHGYSSNSGQQMIYSDFYTIADSEGFVLVYPQGTTDENGFAFWDNGSVSSGVDDSGFLNALIDTIASQHNINTDRVYSMGMSNGGFMSYTLACGLSNKIAAIASVTGSMNATQMTFCSPEHPMPVMQIHGTADPTVLYEGFDLWGIESIEDVVAYWVTFNQCETEPVFNDVPDINLLDLCQAEHYVYENGDNGSSVELYKVINGGHTWPGALIPLVGNNTNQDFNASEKIWEFFAKYDINGLVNPSTNLEEISKQKILIKTVDLLGRKTTRKGINLEIYNDGTTKKKYLIK